MQTKGNWLLQFGLSGGPVARTPAPPPRVHPSARVLHPSARHLRIQRGKTRGRHVRSQPTPTGWGQETRQRPQRWSSLGSRGFLSDDLEEQPMVPGKVSKIKPLILYKFGGVHRFETCIWHLNVDLLYTVYLNCASVMCSNEPSKPLAEFYPCSPTCL